jgi:hypothetical protein
VLASGEVIGRMPPGIFVIWDGMGVVAKRVEHLPHSDPPKVMIKSLNPEYQTYERDAEESEHRRPRHLGREAAVMTVKSGAKRRCLMP